MAGEEAAGPLGSIEKLNEVAGGDRGGADADDPLGMIAAAQATDAAAKKAARGRKKKGNQEDIFKDFGQENEELLTVDIGGVVIQRCNYKRYWQSDKDLQRWQRSLGANSRFNALTFEARAKYHEDFHADRAELLAKHNQMHRSRTEAGLQAALAERDKRKVSDADHLRELQRWLAHGEAKKKGKQNGAKEKPLDLGFGLGAGASSDKGSKESTRDRVAREETERRQARDRGAGDEADPDTDAGVVVEGLSSGAQSQRAGGPVDNTARPASLKEHGRKLPKVHPVIMPRTMALLIFRNSDKLHGGEPVFFSRWPPPGGLQEVLATCAKSCRPFVGPAQVLYTPALVAVRSVDEVTPGAYLLKGHEPNLDPPPLLASHGPTVQEDYGIGGGSSPSLRHISRAKMIVTADQAARHHSPDPVEWAAMSQASMASSASAPSVGSPPWQSLGQVGPLYHGKMWQVDDSIARMLSWGGLGQAHKHHHLHTWRRALHDAPADRFSASCTF